MARLLNVLIIEDRPDDADLVLRELRRGGFEVNSEVVDSAVAMGAALGRREWDVVISDHDMPGFSAPAALDLLKQRSLDIPFVIVSGIIGEDQAVEAMKAGAHDYLTKGHLTRLCAAVHRELCEADSRRARRRAESQVEERTQALSRTNAELLRSNAELEEFAFISSHHLQEPLRMVACFVQLLSSKYSGKLDSEADQYIGFAAEGAKRMGDLIQDILALSTVGRVQSVSERFDCNQALEDVRWRLSKEIEETGAQIRSTGLPVIEGDRSHFVQILQDLVENAFKYRSEDPPLIRIAAERGTSEWLFSVQDNGIGIEPQHCEKIFRVFQRLHRREKYSGNGIGLAIVRKIVTLQGGRVWVESQPGQGSTFFFTLPVSQDSEPAS